MTCTDNRSYLALTQAAIVQQRTVGRTGKLTRTALDTIHNSFFFHSLEFCMFGKCRQQIRFQSHRTSTHALCTTDARLNLTTFGFLLIHYQNTGTTFSGRNLRVDQCLTHHRATADNLTCIFGQTTASINQLLHRRANTCQEVTIWFFLPSASSFCYTVFAKKDSTIAKIGECDFFNPIYNIINRTKLQVLFSTGNNPRNFFLRCANRYFIIAGN